MFGLSPGKVHSSTASSASHTSFTSPKSFTSGSKCLHQQPVEIALSFMAAWTWRYVVRTWRLTRGDELAAARDTLSARHSASLRAQSCSTILSPIRRPCNCARVVLSHLALAISHCLRNRYTEKLQFRVSYRKHKIATRLNRFTFAPLAFPIRSLVSLLRIPFSAAEPMVLAPVNGQCSPITTHQSPLTNFAP